MLVTPKASPASVAENNAPSQSALSARERAIAKLSGSQAPTAPPDHSQHPVQDPSKVSPEEMMAIPSHKPPVGQENTAETPIEESEVPAPEVTAKPKEEPLSAQYAQLARKEKALRAQAQKLKADQDAFKAQQTANQPAAPQPESVDAYKARLLKDPLNTLNEAGLTWDQLTEQALNAPTHEQRAQQAYIAKLEARLESLEKGVKTTQESYEQSQQNAYKQAVNQIRNEAKQLVSSDPAYETIKETNSVNDVVDLIERTFKEDQVLLSVEEAAQAIEDHLVEEALKIAKIKKIQDRLKPAPSPAPQQQAKAQGTQQPQTMKTLTNATGATRKLSTRDRAILAFKGEKYE